MQKLPKDISQQRFTAQLPHSESYFQCGQAICEPLSHFLGFGCEPLKFHAED